MFLYGNAVWFSHIRSRIMANNLITHSYNNVTICFVRYERFAQMGLETVYVSIYVFFTENVLHTYKITKCLGTRERAYVK